MIFLVLGGVGVIIILSAIPEKYRDLLERNLDDIDGHEQVIAQRLCSYCCFFRSPSVSTAGYLN